MKKYSVLLLSLFGATAFADGLNYNYVELGYGRSSLDVDGTSETLDGNGWMIGGSAAINENYHVFGGYDSTAFDFDLDFSTYGIGLGYNREIGANTDVVATVSYIKAKLDYPDFGFGGGSETDSGYGLSLGLRSAVSDAVELQGAIEYVNIADSGEAGLTAGALYNISETFAVGVQGAWADGSSTYGVGVRVYFGQ